jgi:hypothetical protein
LSAQDQRIGKRANGCFVSGWWREVDLFSPISLALVFGQGGRALRIPKLIERSLEIIRRVQVVLKQKLNGAFTRLTSHTHSEKDGGEMPGEERKFSCPLPQISTTRLLL